MCDYAYSTSNNNSSALLVRARKQIKSLAATKTRPRLIAARTSRRLSAAASAAPCLPRSSASRRRSLSPPRPPPPWRETASPRSCCRRCAGTFASSCTVLIPATLSPTDTSPIAAPPSTPTPSNSSISRVASSFFSPPLKYRRHHRFRFPRLDGSREVVHPAQVLPVAHSKVRVHPPLDLERGRLRRQPVMPANDHLLQRHRRRLVRPCRATSRSASS